jgi:hypothetical protein
MQFQDAKAVLSAAASIEQIEEVARQYFEAKYPLMDLTTNEDKSEIDWWDMLQFVQHVLSCRTQVMGSLIVIHEKDHEDKEQSVIGVADTVANANKLIDQYYGQYEQVSFNDIRDSNLEYSKVLRLSGAFGQPYEVTVTLEWFALNSR